MSQLQTLIVMRRPFAKNENENIFNDPSTRDADRMVSSFGRCSLTAISCLRACLQRAHPMADEPFHCPSICGHLLCNT